MVATTRPVHGEVIAEYGNTTTTCVCGTPHMGGGNNMSPCELFSNKPLGVKALHGLDHVKVGHLLELGMLGSVEILLSNHDSLLQKEFLFNINH